MVWQAKENTRPLGLSILLSYLTRSLQLLGNVNNRVSAKHRAQVLSKIGPKYASLSNESWENNGRIEGVRPVTGVLISEASPIVLPRHSGEGEKQQQPSPSQPLQTSEESSSWYRYAPRTFFNAHSFTTTYKGRISHFY